MTKRPSKRSRDTAKLLKLQEAARARYVYFISNNAVRGYWWELIGPSDETIARSEYFPDKADLLKSLRANQRHASTIQVRDVDAR